MIESTKLPDFTFVGEKGSAETVALSGETARIRGCAEALAGKAEAGATIGLCFRSGPELVLWWLGALVAGLRPLIIQYPTGKQARSYWQSSVSDTIDKAELSLIVCDAAVNDRLSEFRPELAFSQEIAAGSSDAPFTVTDYAIMQLSSGTTGFRKAMVFTSDALLRHAEDYNETLRLTGEDCLVSWLPLYHDMGYVACFVMPLILGVPVVMMDPETWVKDKALLYKAIAEHGGTICYMPNFGFEVMSSIPAPEMPGMRLWVSCSEPVLEDTSRKFVAHIGAGEETFAACYAMAENIFAMTQSVGISAREIDGRRVVSNGKPISNVEVKIVEGEIWVRSRTSIESYYGGESITDADGFYPTGDLGELHDGALYITGRKRDLMIQAGKKFMLSAIDSAVNAVFPEARGRVATLADTDARLGTSKPIILIEARDFYLRDDHAEIARRVLDATGLDNVEVEFVPPRFLTKTSSGKMNRPTSLSHWKAVSAATDDVGARPLEAFQHEFGRLPQDRPVGEALDSLASTVLRLILADAGMAYAPEKTLADYAAALEAEGGTEDAVDHSDEVIRIVSLADRRLFKRFTEDDLAALAAKLGRKVEFEHVCLPPSVLLLSDLVFMDYFLPRIEDKAPYGSAWKQLKRLRDASLILVDDAAELHFALNQTYPVFSHRLERAADADLLAFRWQAYVYNHDELPIAPVAGADLDVTDRTQAIDYLSQYLKVPIFKIASVTSLAPFTDGWDYEVRQSASGGPGLRPLASQPFIDRLSDWIDTRETPVALRPATGGPALRLDDLPHFCSWAIDRDAVDAVLSHYDRFCIAGGKYSLAHVGNELERMGKPYWRVTAPTATHLESAPDFDCLIICGPTLAPDTDKPVASIMGGVTGARMHQTEDPEVKDLLFRGHLKSCPPDEWFHLTRVTGQSVNLSDVDAANCLARDVRDQRLADRRAGKAPPPARPRVDRPARGRQTPAKRPQRAGIARRLCGFLRRRVAWRGRSR